MARITQKQVMQDIIRRYKLKTGETEINMKDVARFAASLGVKLPNPKDPLHTLA